MSYMDSLRVHFAGRFLADVSTINNHPAHYENAAFDRSRHWRRGSGPSVDHGWWHPEGTHRFKFENVAIRSAFLINGSMADRDRDGIYGFQVESRGRRAAKMADLDPDQQMVSMLFGLRLAFVDGDGRIAMEGEFEPAPFSDIWRRGLSGRGDEDASAFYQSVLRVTTWGDLGGSSFLQELRAAASDGLLSVKFQVDGYSMNFRSPTFATGRLVGTIGPAMESEPRHWVAGRHLGAEVFPVGSANPGFRPSGGVNYCVALHDSARGKARIDLGNALLVDPAGGPVSDVGRLILGCRKSDGTTVEIADIPYETGDWYERTAGVVEVPVGRELSDDESRQIGDSKLCIILDRDGQKSVVIEEPETHIRADMFVARMNAGGTFMARFRASRLGKPIPNATVNVFLFVPAGPDARASFPVSGLQFSDSVTCDADGIAEITFTANDPGDPRFFYSGARRIHVDGQVYRLGYRLVINGAEVPTANPSDSFSILVWNTFTAGDPPTWHGSMKEVFTQYGNLYPWMTRFGPQLDLADYEQVADARQDIIDVLSLPETDQAYMPVTRDLSDSKRRAMLKWLREVAPDGKPLLGTAPDSVPATPLFERMPAGGIPEAELGAKVAGASRPILLRHEPN